jgi:hypothetical protein
MTLDELSRRVRDARTSVQENRRGAANSPDIVAARRRLLEELEQYVGALESRRLPVPPALRAELALLKRLSGTHNW